MQTGKLKVSKIQFEDWFVVMDLKDAYLDIIFLPEQGKFPTQLILPKEFKFYAAKFWKWLSVNVGFTIEIAIEHMTKIWHHVKIDTV